MNTRQKQLGITLMGFLIAIIIAGIFIMFAAKVVPMYTEFNSVKSSMETYARQPGAANLPPDQMWSKIDRIFSTQYVTSVKRNNLQIIKKGPPRLVVNYEVRTSLVYNLDIVGRFTHEQPLSAGR